MNAMLENIRMIPIRCFFESRYSDSYVYGAQKYEPEHKENRLLDAYYEWLTDFGYQLSETEQQLKDGTHPCFKVKSNEQR